MDSVAQLFAACARIANASEPRDGITGVDVGFRTDIRSEALKGSQLHLRIHSASGTDVLSSVAHSLADHVAALPMMRLAARYGIGPIPDQYVPQALWALPPRRSEIRPAVPGTSISRAGNARRGTLGLIVQNAGGTAFGLSCAHVLRKVGLENNAIVSQPAAPSGRNALGTMCLSIDNSYGDAAIFEITDRPPARQTMQFGTQHAITSADFAVLGEPIMKSSVATDLRCGVVDGIGYYRLSDGGELMMGFRVRPADGSNESLSAAEDSGAVWYRPATMTGLGLHTGYDLVGKRHYAVASHLPCVLQALGVTPLR